MTPRTSFCHLLRFVSTSRSGACALTWLMLGMALRCKLEAGVLCWRPVPGGRGRWPVAGFSCAGGPCLLAVVAGLVLRWDICSQRGPLVY